MFLGLNHIFESTADEYSRDRDTAEGCDDIMYFDWSSIMAANLNMALIDDLNLYQAYSVDLGLSVNEIYILFSLEVMVKFTTGKATVRLIMI